MICQVVCFFLVYWFLEGFPFRSRELKFDGKSGNNKPMSNDLNLFQGVCGSSR